MLSPLSVLSSARRASARLLRLGPITAGAFVVLVTSAHGQQPSQPPLLDAMTTELHRAYTMLGRQQQPNETSEDKLLPPYFLSYSVTESDSASIRAQYGAIVGSTTSHVRVGDVQVRVGSAKLDNTHGSHRASAVSSMQLPLSDDHDALMRTMWLATNNGYSTAIDNFLRVKTESQVRAAEEDNSPDFSEQTAQVKIEQPAPPIKLDRSAWEQRIRAVSGIFRDYPDVYQNMVVMSVQNQTEYFASSEGSRLVAPHMQARIVMIAATRAEDGMDLFRDETFEALTADGLPSQADLESAARKLGQSLEQLRKAPVTEPFNGPAILSGRATAVFFHEVLGHRLEGQRQRGNEEGQTFTKDIGKEVLPSFLSVSDDPTQSKFGNTWLSGHYEFDDEGQKAQRVNLIENGVLKTFLMSRLPIADFGSSNGHGRSEPGRIPTGRQGNLIVTSTRTANDTDLRKQLIEEAKKQGKPYGLYFEDISSGFAVTTRNSPQAFQVMPLVVWRVYVDGRPDELVRGVSIVGTPLAALKRIISTSDKSEVFNGECGAESGTVPVSAVAPAMLLSELETQRQAQGTARPPILPIPGARTKPEPTKEAQ